MSRETAYSLTGQVYSPATQAEYDAKQIVLILFAQAADNKCSTMPPEIRREFDSLIRKITTDFGQAAGASALAQVQTASREAFARNSPSCDDKTTFSLRNALMEARRMASR